MYLHEVEDLLPSLAASDTVSVIEKKETYSVVYCTGQQSARPFSAELPK